MRRRQMGLRQKKVNKILNQWLSPILWIAMFDLILSFFIFIFHFSFFIFSFFFTFHFLQILFFTFYPSLFTFHFFSFTFYFLFLIFHFLYFTFYFAFFIFLFFLFFPFQFFISFNCNHNIYLNIKNLNIRFESKKKEKKTPTISELPKLVNISSFVVFDS